MNPPSRFLTALIPGLALVGLLTAVSYLLARVPALALMGPLVVALVVGLAWRALAGLPGPAAAGARFSARTLLRLGIVLLGVRLDFGLLVKVGPEVLLGSLLVVTLGICGIEWLGRLAGLPPGLRRGIAVGTSICGASAILAAAPSTRMSDEEAGVSVGIISTLGTLGVLVFALLSSLLEPADRIYGFIVGSTLQEVAQVIAAGYVPGNEAGDLATIVKLTRVALLAPVLLVLNSVLKGPSTAADTPHLRPAGASRFRLPVPLFLLGFLAVGVLASLGWLPAGVSRLMQSGSLLLTTMAMVGLGLGLDLLVFRRVGTRALIVGATGFAGLVAVMIPYALFVAR
ncbi:MAG TPA: putative sulfate exporter family transporter [Trueperaceae bacterium]